MLKLRIVEGHLKYRIAAVERDGIRYRGRTYRPVSLRTLDQTASDAGSALAGAAVGGLALGPAGLVAGAMLGGRGRTPFIVETDHGRTLIGTIPSAEFVELYAEVERLKNVSRSGRPPERAASAAQRTGFGWRLLLGPLYFMNYGAAALLVALWVTVLTIGFAWLILPFVAGFIDARRRTKPASMSTTGPHPPAAGPMSPHRTPARIVDRPR